MSEEEADLKADEEQEHSVAVLATERQDGGAMRSGAAVACWTPSEEGRRQ